MNARDWGGASTRTITIPKVWRRSSLWMCLLSPGYQGKWDYLANGTIWLPMKVPHLVNLLCKDINVFIRISDIAYSRYEVYILPTWIILFFPFFSLLNFIMCALWSVCGSQRIICRCWLSPFALWVSEIEFSTSGSTSTFTLWAIFRSSLFAMKSKPTSDLSSSSLCLHSARLQVVPIHLATQNFWAGAVSHQKNTCWLRLNWSC